MKKRPFSPKKFKEIYSKVPRVTVSLVIKIGGGKVLTLRNLPHWKGKWHLPGGTILYDETVRGAINRVAQEELGVKVKFLKLLGWIEYPSEKKERGFGRSVDMICLCKCDNSKFRLSDEISGAEIFTKLPKNVITEQARFLKINKILT